MFKAIVMGGGPAGASAALGLRSRGAEVVLLEQRTAWTGRVCGSFLNAEAIRHLKTLGVWPALQGKDGIPVSRCLLTGPGKRKTWVELNSLGERGYALPRKILEEELMNQAQERGVLVKTGARATDFYHEKNKWVVRTSGPSRPQSFETADLLVAGNGRFFSPFKQDNKEKPKTGWYGWTTQLTGVHDHPGHLSLHFYDKGYVGILHFADGTANVSGLFYRSTPDPFLWEDVYEEVLEKQPHFRQMVKGADRVGSWQGVGPLPFRYQPQAFDSLILTGDAAAVSEPFLGEGIGRGLASGPMISKAIGQTIQQQLAWADEEGEDLFLKLDRKRFFDDLHQNYRKIWLQSYKSRLRFGGASRNLIKTKGVNRLFLNLLLSQKWLSSRLAARFHVGFRNDF